ncbi:di-trans,poly-cis-decaprenylcistransferase [Candidatus Azambacteria bacterium]|nr:di-trans,poly-cis-decaprenylcistransferase [Candidatus Azambacteria bacterium]
MISEELEALDEEGVMVKFVGQVERFPADIQKGIENIERETKNNKKITLFIALSYGGRAEILNAVSKILENGGKKELTEAGFAKDLWTKDMPDPDLIIRTGGEMRLSNFLLWQSAYSELFFTDTYWPDFSKREFLKIISDFYKREKRFGR